MGLLQTVDILGRSSTESSGQAREMPGGFWNKCEI